jgi:hypothetical protein
MFIAAAPGVVFVALRYADLTHAVAAKSLCPGRDQTWAFCAKRIAQQFHFADRGYVGKASSSAAMQYMKIICRVNFSLTC